ncbi:MAG: glycosyl hydrolase [Reichenbachiella sp.]|uniref:glycosyl hydrolase n=1 Tax=Reichenbachiella sp. TaxID=2184521 RepID=UPI0032662240
MKRALLNFILILIVLTNKFSLNDAFGQTVSVGSGSYTTTFPGVDAAGRNTFPSGTPQLSGIAATKPVPTNDWWSDLMKSDHGGKAFSYPLSFKSMSNGLVINYTIPLGSGPTDYREPISDVNAIVVGTDGLNASLSTPSNHSDWSVTMNWNDDFNATMNIGSPFVYFEKNTGAAAKVSVNFNATGVSVDGNKLVVVDNMNNSNYVVFGPSGSTWSGSGGVYTSTLNGNNYWSMALLPFGVDINAAIAELEPYAYVFPGNTEVDWNYNESTGSVSTTFTVTPDVKEGINSSILQGLLPHQWDRLAAASPLPNGPTYPSVRGTIKTLASNTFIVENTFSGILPTLPDLGKYSNGFDPGALASKISQIKNDGLPEWTDSYNQGQDMNRLIQAARIADQMGDTETRDLMVSTVQTRLEDWLTYESGEVAFLFYYNSDWKSLLGYPAGHRQDENLNDHHFHWGYFIHAAAAIEQFNPGWAEQWGDMINLLARDATNPSRNDSMFPFLRNFSPYGGHSWANGFATEPFGNDQESTSESMQFNSALIHWGTLTGNDELRDLGIYLYTTELSTIQEYWFDVEERSFQPEYAYEMVARVWGGGYDNGTWWTDDKAASYGIQLYPIHGGSLYLGHRADYVQRVWTEMTQNTDVLNNIPNANLWYDTYWKFLSFIDPQQAVNLYDSYADRDIKVGISDGHTYHWLHAMNAMGQVKNEITADYPIAAAFEDNGSMTYAAHNYGNSQITVHFSDGYNLNVPANSMATNRDVTVDIALTIDQTEVPVAGSVNMTASVSGSGVTKVEFYVGDQLIGTDNSAPYSMNSGSLAAGFPSLYAKAYIGSGLNISNVIAVQVGAQAAYSGTPVAIPGTIEAGLYDTFEGGNGQGIAYSDNNSFNEGNFRPEEGVDASTTTNEGATVGWIDPGEWLEYTVNASQAGAYQVTLRYASGNTAGGGPFWFERDGTKISSDINVNFTGTDWNVWQNVITQNVNLVAGEQVIRVQVGNGGFNLGKMTFELTGTSEPVLTSISVTPSNSSIAPDATQQFTAVGLDQFGAPFATNFTWSSTCGTISNGLYTAPSTAGSCTVTVSSGALSADATVTVNTQGSGIGNVLWEENFNALNTEQWNPNTGDGCDIGLCGWGNQELEYYSPNNVYVEDISGEPGNSALVLEAKNESIGNSSFSSGKVDTDGKVSIHYGLIEVRMKVPDLATGLWPAAWLLGDANLTWPAKGEIDMMEMGHAATERERQGFPGVTENDYVGANAIWQAPDGSVASIAWDVDYNQPYIADQPLNDRFVTYRLYWEPTQMRFSVIDNGTEHDLYTNPLPIDENGELNAFNKPFYMLLNLAVGGNFTDAASPGQVTAPLPAKMYIDYVKVSQYNGHGSVTFTDGSLPAESGVFGVFTEDTPTNNQLNFGTDAEIFAWGETVQEGTTAPYEGTEVIAWETTTANSWFGGGISSLYGRNMSNYVENGSLKFKIKIPGDVTFRIGVTDNYTNEQYVSFPAGQTTYGLVRDGEWGQVEIPIADLEGIIAFQDMNYLFAIVSQDGALPTSTFQFAIDDIVWDDGNGNSTPVLTSVNLSPPNATISEGSTQQFTAAGFDQFGNPFTINPTWSTTGGSVDSNGLFTGSTAGSFTVSASDGSVSGTASITVNAVAVPVLTSIILSPANITIDEGGTQQFTAAGFDQFGDPFAINPTWTSTGGSISAAGLFTGTAAGTFTVTANEGAISGTAEVQVNVVGGNECTGGPSNGDYTYSVSGDSSNPTITFEPGYAGVGDNVVILFYGFTPGGGYPGYIVAPNSAYAITASAGQTVYFYYTYSVPEGGERNTANDIHSVVIGDCGSVEVPVLTTITVSPSNATINEGATQQFTASGFDQFGDAFTINPTWSTTGGSVDNNGWYTGSVVGSFTVTASQDGLSGTANITVEAASAGWALLGRIEAENFNGGGEGVGYHDLTSGNTGGAFRNNEDVDIEPTTDSQGGLYNIGWIDAGEWLAYDINATATSNSYDLSLRVASPSGSGQLHIEIDGVDVTGILSVPNTGGWQNFTTIIASNVNVPAGNHTMRVVFDASGLNLNYIEGGESSAPVPVLTTITVSPSNATIDEGSTQQFTATGFDQFGDAFVVNPNWTATGGSMGNSGLYTGSAVGSFTVTATQSGVIGSANIAVNAISSICSIAGYTGDFSAEISSDANDLTMTFVPSRASVGDNIVILYYATSANGPWPGYIVNPGQPYQINANEGQTIHYYYTYSLPEGGENNTSANKDSFVVGSCVSSARIRGTSTDMEEHLDEGLSSLQLYPNPAQDLLKIQSSRDAILSLSVFNLMGMHIIDQSYEIGQQVIELDVSDFDQGNYFIRANSLNDTQILRFIKQ